MNNTLLVLVTDLQRGDTIVNYRGDGNLTVEAVEALDVMPPKVRVVTPEGPVFVSKYARLYVQRHGKNS